jgi:hypothetical protein
MELAAHMGAQAGLGNGSRLACRRQPTVEPPPDDVYLSADLKKALQQATKLQKKRGDSFLGALLEHGGGGLARKVRSFELCTW